MSRNLLHRTKVDDFKGYLDANGVSYRDGQGDYQVIQVKVGSNWLVVYDRDKGDHFTVDRRMDGLVKHFIRDNSNAICDIVTIPRAEYEHLLWLTTPKPIETAPKRGVNILLSNGRTWRQGYHHDDDGWIGVDAPTHWQPMPNTPMPITAKPKPEDAEAEGNP